VESKKQKLIGRLGVEGWSCRRIGRPKLIGRILALAAGSSSSFAQPLASYRRSRGGWLG